MLTISDILTCINNMSKQTIIQFNTQCRNGTIKHNNCNFLFLGKGGEGCVYKVGNYAVKFYKSSNDKNQSNELVSMMHCTKLFEKNVTNQLMKLEGHTVVHNYTVIIMKLISGSLEDWILQSHSEQEWYKMIFQVTYGVLCLQKCLKMFHSDLKPKNILFKTLDTPITINFKVQNELDITFETNTEFYLADFGHAQSLLFKKNKLSNSNIENALENNTDLEHLSEFNKRLIVSILLENYSIEQIISLAKDDPNVTSYIKNERNKLTEKFKNFPPHVLNNMIKRSISYYVYEKGYVLTDSLDQTKIKLPPDIIAQFLPTLNTKINIIELLKKIMEHIDKSKAVPKHKYCLTMLL